MLTNNVGDSGCSNAYNTGYESVVDEKLLSDWDTWKNDEIPGEREHRDIAVELMKKAKNDEDDYLDISNLNLTSIPNVFLPKLKIMKISKNKIKKLPDILPPSLEKLDASFNQFVELPQRFTGNLRCIILKNNYITKLPDFFPETLKKIDVSHNNISCIECAFPNGVEEINVSYNDLSKLFDVPLNLQLLYANNNKIDEITKDMPLSLELANIRHNIISKLPDEYFLPTRENLVIYLEGNKFSKEDINILIETQKKSGYLGASIFTDPLFP